MYEFVTDLIRPFPLCLLFVGLAIVGLWYRQSESRRRLLPLTVLFLLLVIVCTPVVSYVALGSLEWQYPPLAQRPDTIRAIVVLGGGLSPPDTVRPHAVLNEDSLYRSLRAAELYHQGEPCLVIASGGKVDPTEPGPTLATAMRELLLQLGIADEHLLIEDGSRTTYENAVESSKLLKQRGIDEIVLVTDAVSLYRAERCFHRQGIKVVPAGCNYRATELEASWTSLWPSPGAARGFQAAQHEWIGLLWYWLRGRI